jgi:phosphohistidine phosphatase SixA
LVGSIADLLRRGGYIIYARHGQASVGLDHPDLDFQNCLTQRNLSDLGRREAVYYGQILRYLRIPTSYPIVASPFCRAIETAQQAFGNTSVQVDPFWYHGYRLSSYLPPQEQSRILEALQARLEIIPPQGSNSVIISHSFPPGIALGQIPNMGTVVIRPRGQGQGYEIIARLSLTDMANFMT